MYSQLYSSFPTTRLRRLRNRDYIRRLVRENTLLPSDLVAPMFLQEGKNIKEVISSMPGIHRQSIDLAIQEIKTLSSKGVPAVALFPSVPDRLKSSGGDESYNSAGLVQNAIKRIKEAVPEIGIISDVALDPYTTHGHDGLINENGDILNDETIEILVRQSISQAEAGIDIIAPSDMMDGRVAAIRAALDARGFQEVKILAYSAKYASAFYGPFRDAIGSAKNIGPEGKKTYQMDPGNSLEAIREVALDVAEGADMVMVKPGMPYLDIITRIKQEFGMPTFAYQVSGEYSMIKAASENGWLDEKSAVLESLLCFKRAGADGVLSYFTKDVIDWLHES